MSQSLASMSNASSYTFDLKDSLKDGAPGGLKINMSNYNTQANSRVQLEFSVKRNGSLGSLPALSSKNVSQKAAQPKTLNPWDNLNIPRQSAALSASVESIKAPPQPAVAPEVSKSYSLPALQPVSKSMNKSKSGPALLVANFANGVNSFGKRKSRGGDSGVNNSEGPTPVVEHAAEDVDEKLALTRLIALRARKEEVREFLRSCCKNLHRGPWCRVSAR